MSARDDYSDLEGVDLIDAERALVEIDRLRAEVARHAPVIEAAKAVGPLLRSHSKDISLRKSTREAFSTLAAAVDALTKVAADATFLRNTEGQPEPEEGGK